MSIDINTGQQWKDYDNLYQASNLGNFRNKVTLNQKKPTLRKSGYLSISLYHSKTFLLHRLIASVFLPNPNNLRCVNHKDGNKQNNHIENLEWCTHQHNTAHAISTGLLNNFKSEKKIAHLAKISAKKRRPIVQCNLSGVEIKRYDSITQCQKELGISNVGSCCKGLYKQTNGFIFKYLQKELQQGIKDC